MRKLAGLLFIVAAVGLVLTAASFGRTRATAAVWTAKLTPGDVPKQSVRNTSAGGSFRGTLRGYQMKFKLTVSKVASIAPDADRSQRTSAMNTKITHKTAPTVRVTRPRPMSCPTFATRDR